MIQHGKTPAGYFYSSANYAANEHGGTHLDAPIHFHEAGATVDHVFVCFFYDIYPDGRKILADLGINMHWLATWWDILRVSAPGPREDRGVVARSGWARCLLEPAGCRVGHTVVGSREIRTYSLCAELEVLAVEPEGDVMWDLGAGAFGEGLRVEDEQERVAAAAVRTRPLLRRAGGGRPTADRTAGRTAIRGRRGVG